MLSSITVFNSHQPLTKRIYRKPDGSIGKSAAILASGKATRTDVESLSELSDIISSLTRFQCLSYGITARLSAQIGSAAYLKHGQIARNRDNFSWPSGPGVFFIDIDGSYSPDDVPSLRARLAAAVPELAGAGQLWVPSSSSGIRDPETGVVTKGGFHCYLLLDRADHAPRIGKVLADRLWLTGNGDHELSRSGAILERCLVDTAVWQPERLDYAAPPVLEDGLELVAAEHQRYDGPAVCTKAIPDLTDDEAAEVLRLKLASRRALKPEIQKARKAILADLDAPAATAQKRQWLAADRRSLDPAHELHFHRPRVTVTVADVLASPEQYEGRELADPLEPDYNDDPRIAVFQRGYIYSHARGGRTLRLLSEPMTAPAGELVAEPIASDSDIVSACYRHRALLSAGGMEKVVEETGADLEHCRSVWFEHLGWKARPLHLDGVAHVLDTFDEAREIIDRGESGIFLAPLGSGKTKHLGAPAMLNAKGRALSVTKLRSLTHSHTVQFNAIHYRDATALRHAAPRVATTVHSLAKQDMNGVSTIVFDEAAANAELLCEVRDGQILNSAKQRDTLALLKDQVEKGTQIVALDGDQTPTLRLLARELKLPTYTIKEQPYTPPTVNVVAQARNGTTWHSRIAQQLKRGEQVAIATDSKKKAEQLGHLFASYDPLVIHADTAHDEGSPQAAFLADPETEAKRHQLVIYTPAMGVGVSIVGTSPHVYVMQCAGSLDPTGMWQLARRYRVPAGGVINWSVSQNLARAQATFISERELMADVIEDAEALGYHNDPTAAGFAAQRRQRRIMDCNPLLATIGHLHNLRVLGNAGVETEAEAVAETKLAKAAVLTATIERIATAPHATDEEAEQAPQNEAGAAIRERHSIEKGLGLATSGELDRDLVEQCLTKNLVSRVARLVRIHRRAAGAELDSLAKPATYAENRHRNAQADFMRTLLADLADAEGRIVVTASRAQELAHKYYRKIRVSWADIPKPRKDASPTAASRWLRDLLTAHGYANSHTHASNGNRSHYFDIAENVEPHYLRLTASTCTPLEAA